MPIRAVLFDLDGTLLDSLADIAQSMNIVLRERGLAGHSSDSYRAFVGDGVTKLVERALPPERRGREEIAACVDRMREVYGKRCSDRTRPYDGIAELLDALVERGLPLAVLSNKPHDLTVRLVSELLSRWAFAFVFGERPGVPRKPDPSSAREVAALLGVEPRDCLYVGDTPTDMATANAAGMPSVGACWGFRDAEELRNAGAGALASTPTDVVDRL
jgi:phosphoglycolate phosphatase